MGKKLTFYDKIAKAKLELDLAKQRYETLCEIARSELSMGSHTEDGVTVSVQPNRTWNKKKALESWGDKICTPQVDMAKAREVMTGNEFDSYYQEGAPKIVVKVD